MVRLNSTVLAISTFLMALGVGAAQQMSPVLPAFTPQQTSALVGIVAGQTARLNALNPGVPAPLATAARCPAQVSIVDDQGNVLQTAQILVNPGKSTNLDFVMSASGRLEIRALISFTQPTPTASGTTVPIPVSVCNLVPSLEIFDTGTGKTETVLTDFRSLGFTLFTPGTTAIIPPGLSR